MVTLYIFRVPKVMSDLAMYKIKKARQNVQLYHSNISTYSSKRIIVIKIPNRILHKNTSV